MAGAFDCLEPDRKELIRNLDDIENHMRGGGKQVSLFGESAAEEKEPRLDRLGGVTWANKKRKVRKAVRKHGIRNALLTFSILLGVSIVTTWAADLAWKHRRALEQERLRQEEEAGKEAEVLAIYSMGINLFRLLMIYLKPVLPKMAEAAEAFLNVAPLTWADIETPLTGYTISKFKPLMTRIEQETIDRMVYASQEDLTATHTKKERKATMNIEPIAEEIEFDEMDQTAKTEKE